MTEVISIEEERIGSLQFTRQDVFYIARYQWRNSPCLLRLRSDSGEDLREFLTAFMDLLTNHDHWDEQAKAFAAKELLPVKNNLWVKFGEDELSESEFIENLTIRSLSFSQKSFAIRYDDNNMFYGHEIRVFGNMRDGFKSADI